MPTERGQFVKRVVDRMLAESSPALGPYRRALRWSLGQIWTGNRDLHYEVWRRSSLGVVEIGLHFEADLLTNARLLGAFRAREAEIRRKLGRAPIFEEWDKGWARIYEAHPLTGDDEDALARRCAERLAAYVRALEPILREELPADVPWELGAKRRTHKRAPASAPR